MPLPKPRPDESENAFMERCMSDPKMEEEYPDPDQRLAVCNSLWENESDLDDSLKEALKQIKEELQNK